MASSWQRWSAAEMMGRTICMLLAKDPGLLTRFCSRLLAASKPCIKVIGLTRGGGGEGGGR